jgi:hypothetical protein
MNDKALQTTNVLITHQNFPGQFSSIALHLWQQPNIKVIGIGEESAPRQYQRSQHQYCVLNKKCEMKVLSVIVCEVI